MVRIDCASGKLARALASACADLEVCRGHPTCLDAARRDTPPGRSGTLADDFAPQLLGLTWTGSRPPGLMDGSTR